MDRNAMRLKILLTCLSLAFGTFAFSQTDPVVINVDAAHPGAAISPQMLLA